MAVLTRKSIVSCVLLLLVRAILRIFSAVERLKMTLNDIGGSFGFVYGGFVYGMRRYLLSDGVIDNFSVYFGQKGVNFTFISLLLHYYCIAVSFNMW